MKKKEYEILVNLVGDVEKSDDKIEALESLYFEVRKMICK